MSNSTSPLQSQADRSLMRDLRSSSQPALSRGFIAQHARGSYLIALDTIALVASRYLSEALGAPWNPMWSFKESPSIILLIVGINISIFLSNGLYKSGRSRRDYPAIFKSVSISSLLLLLVAFLYLPNELISRSTFALFWLLSFLFVSFGRYFSNLIVNKIHDLGYLLHPVFVITNPENEERILSLVQSCPHYKLKGLDNIQALSPDRINSTIRRLHALKVSELYIHSDSLEDPMHVYWKFQHAGIAIYLLPEDLTPIFREAELSYINNVPCFKMNVPSITGVNFWLKRSLDFVFSVVLLVLLSPVYILLSVLIYLDDPGAIFYRQTRIGLHGKPFKVWKFRTMVSNADQLQKELESRNENRDGILFKIKDDPRITRLGKFLRNYSLDELPQIFNIFLGEMSLIGPRPLPVRDVEKFESHHHVRHEVLPGITGLWQVSGRSDINNFDDVLRLDVQYIERWSIWLDLKILLKTIAVIFAKSGAY
jgi:exopolysaccharide biosynthesis polyprenyl glycosylphosphotransferase